MNVAIREATPRDAAEIARLHVATWQAAYRDDLPDELLDGLSVVGRERQWKGIIENPEPRSNVFVAERADEMLGFASCGACRDDDLMEFDVGEIYAVYVDPNHWRRGIGRALLRRVVEFLEDRDFDFMSLWVLESNDQARDFYEKSGFIPDGTESTDEKRGVPLHKVRYRAMLPSN